MNLRFWAATDTGRVRDHNEDNFLVDKNLQLFVVCDGMGGHAAGEVASAVCVRTVREVVAAETGLLATLRDNPDDEIATENLKAVLRRAVKTGNNRIFTMAQEDPSRKGMGTTCTALVLAGNRGFVGHVGDSRMYRLRDGTVEQITDDHSLLNEMIRQGQVAPGTTEEEFQHRNAVTRAVGVRESVDVDAFSFEIRAGDRLLMCSDGLSEYLGETVDFNAMISQGDPKEVTTGCITFANESGGKDNITVVVVDCERQPAEQPEPAAGLDDEHVAKLVRQTPYFHYLNASEVEQILDLTRRVDVDAHEAVVDAQQDNDSLYLLVSGSVALSLDDEPVSVLQSGDHFGEMALIDAQDEHDTNLVAIAKESSTLLSLQRDRFVGLFQQAPQLALKLLWNFAQVFADRLQGVPPEFRYTTGREEAEPDAISDVTGKRTVSEKQLREKMDSEGADEQVSDDAEQLSDEPEQVSDDPDEAPDAVAARGDTPDREPAVQAGDRLRTASGSPSSPEDQQQTDPEESTDTDEGDDEALRETVNLKGLDRSKLTGLEDRDDASEPPGVDRPEGDVPPVPPEETEQREQTPSVQINAPGSRQQSESSPSAPGDDPQPEDLGETPGEQGGDETPQDDGDDLRATVKLDWNADRDKLHPPAGPPQQDQDSDPADARPDAMTAELDLDRDQLRRRVEEDSDPEKPVPKAGVLRSPSDHDDSSGEPQREAHQQPDGPGTREDGDANHSGEHRKPIAGESTVGDEDDAAPSEPEEPKIMVAPDLMADSGEE